MGKCLFEANGLDNDNKPKGKSNNGTDTGNEIELNHRRNRLDTTRPMKEASGLKEIYQELTEILRTLTNSLRIDGHRYHPKMKVNGRLSFIAI